jgi:hypothetical protein
MEPHLLYWKTTVQNHTASAVEAVSSESVVAHFDDAAPENPEPRRTQNATKVPFDGFFSCTFVPLVVDVSAE